MKEFDKAQLMSEEMNRLRQDLILCSRSQHRVIFVFVTAFVSVLGIYFGKEIITERQKAVLILLLSQFEVLLCLFYASLLSYQNVRVGYMRALERKLNELAKENILIWQSEITKKYMASPFSSFFILCLVQSIAYIVIFILLIYFTFEITNHVLWGVGFTIEAMICLGLNIWAISEPKRIERFANEK